MEKREKSYEKRDENIKFIFSADFNFICSASTGCSHAEKNKKRRKKLSHSHFTLLLNDFCAEAVAVSVVDGFLFALIIGNS